MTKPNPPIGPTYYFYVTYSRIRRRESSTQDGDGDYGDFTVASDHRGRTPTTTVVEEAEAAQSISTLSDAQKRRRYNEGMRQDYNRSHSSSPISSDWNGSTSKRCFACRVCPNSAVACSFGALGSIHREIIYVVPFPELSAQKSLRLLTSEASRPILLLIVPETLGLPSSTQASPTPSALHMM
ncbi:hypothetical protein K435DRAFT_876357 [Dendrothele bispora CBS 962.96]|uniref:Uncharacterized protein n=1 Tax=Dendrothele bispora (strain CBS 962.96) TaxID=1314807 RepID=A0A4S8KSK0_DENBC|nr:hypothetical protein K435DRAFT_876357 [Dendrothele bispora CBS 962.96]